MEIVKGRLLDKNKVKTWDTEEFVGDLNTVETLTCKPKIILIQACRGSNNFFLLCTGIKDIFYSTIIYNSIYFKCTIS